MGLTGLKLPRSKACARVEEALQKTGMKQVLKKPYNELSGGQKQRVQIARSLVQGAELLFLDEPLSSLDPESKESIAALLSSLEETILVISHEHEHFIRYNWIFHTMQNGCLI